MSFLRLFPLFQQLTGKDGQAAAPAEPGAGIGGEGVSGKYAGGIVIQGSYLHRIGGGTEKTQLLLGPEGIVSGVEIAALHLLSALGAVHVERSFLKNKKALVSNKETKANETSAVPLFLPEKGAPPTTQVRPGNGGRPERLTAPKPGVGPSAPR